ncbi:hypothetical protein GUJ93_ZPchr0003g16569 [Zizania palustris]|uniref:Uncharacterized protein n=1 Tax=Zizania palustris TaxID=103762 RepID=A0A8J5SWW7_ZIZPA|nr:hypothetical protein GUJ93_ZPchr0003g16569 [Zizania palustris]
MKERALALARTYGQRERSVTSRRGAGGRTTWRACLVDPSTHRPLGSCRKRAQNVIVVLHGARGLSAHRRRCVTPPRSQEESQAGQCKAAGQAIDGITRRHASIRPRASREHSGRAGGCRLPPCPLNKRHGIPLLPPALPHNPMHYTCYPNTVTTFEL